MSRRRCLEPGYEGGGGGCYSACFLQVGLSLVKAISSLQRAWEGQSETSDGRPAVGRVLFA